MKSHTEYLWFNTDTRRQYLNITENVSEAIRKSGINEGLALVSAMQN